jgi:hypothetical protein
VGIGKLTVTLEALSNGVLHLTQDKIPDIKLSLCQEVVNNPKLHPRQSLSVAKSRK